MRDDPPKLWRAGGSSLGAWRAPNVDGRYRCGRGRTFAARWRAGLSAVWGCAEAVGPRALAVLTQGARCCAASASPGELHGLRRNPGWLESLQVFCGQRGGPVRLTIEGGLFHSRPESMSRFISSRTTSSSTLVPCASRSIARETAWTCCPTLPRACCCTI